MISQVFEERRIRRQEFTRRCKQIIKKARKSIHAAGASTRAAPSPNIPIILQAAGHVKVRLPGPEARPPYSQRASQTSLENQKRT